MRTHHFKEKRAMIMVSVDKLVTQAASLRQTTPREGLNSLEESIRQNGILQPLTVCKQEGIYRVISGVRRLQAAKRLGLAKVPCVVVTAGPVTAAVMTLAENLHRQDLHFLEEAVALQGLMTCYGLSSEDTAARLGMTSAALEQKLALLSLTPWQRERIVAAGLSRPTAEALLQLPDPQARDEVLLQTIAHSLTEAQTRARIDQLLGQGAPTPCRKAAVADIRLFTNTVEQAVSTIRRLGGQVEVSKGETMGGVTFHITIVKSGDEPPAPQQLKLFV